MNALVCDLKCTDVLETLNCNRLTIVFLLVEVHRLHDAGIDSIHETAAYEEEKNTNDVSDNLVHYFWFLYYYPMVHDTRDKVIKSIYELQLFFVNLHSKMEVL